MSSTSKATGSLELHHDRDTAFTTDAFTVDVETFEVDTLTSTVDRMDES